ncbi:MAG: glycosyltransferase [candidate division Zixibacteria bacterium]|nr:glycosyltransferase [candidate division Zixibacteria bacterium]
MIPSNRLLLISNRYPAGPNDTASPFVYDFRKALEQRGLEIDIVTPHYQSPRDDYRYIDDRVHPFQWSDGRKVISQLPLYNPLSLFKMRRYLRNGYKTAAKLLDKQEYSAIMALWALPSGYIASRLSRQYNIPYAVWALGSDINCWATKPFVGRLTVSVLKKADILYADGYELAMKVQALSDKDCRFIPSFHSIEFEKVPYESSEKYFLCPGRVEKGKGVFDLLEAFRLFHSSHNDWKLYYVGAGRAENDLQRKIVSQRLEKSVRCFGYLERKAFNRLVRLAVAVIIPSHSDSLPLTFGEAMQLGRPVITSDVGDMPYLVDRYKVGYHFPAGDIGALAERMDWMNRASTDFAASCPAVVKILDIRNAAEAVTKWLDTLTLKEKVPDYDYARA